METFIGDFFSLKNFGSLLLLLFLRHELVLHIEFIRYTVLSLVCNITHYLHTALALALALAHDQFYMFCT